MDLRQLVRLLAIHHTASKYRLEEFIPAVGVLRPVRSLQKLTAFMARRAARDLPRGVRVRLALEELGPIFVKFGQALSTRRDLLPTDIADELARLQDDVPPFASGEVLRIVEAAYGRSANEQFASFNEQCLAAASIAQVHEARLHDGTQVVVKLLRPGMREMIRRDLDVMYSLAALTGRYWQHGARLRPVEVVAEYEKTILDELDLMREAANAAQLKRNFEGSDKLYVPEVYWDYCRSNVLVMEQIRGIPVSDMDALRRAGTDIRRLAENGVEIFFTQVFQHNFFHADMHPGNIFVDASDPQAPKYVEVDFGIVGTLDPRDQRYLAGNFLAFFRRDYHRIAKLHIDSGWVPADTRIDELESAIRTVCEPIFNKPLKEISFGQVLLRLFQTAQRFNMQVQPQLILLQKTLLNIEGLGRQLYPDLDLWKTAQPIFEEWLGRRVGGRGLLEDLGEQLPPLADALRQFPALLHTLLQQAAEGELRIKVEEPRLDKLRDEIRQQTRVRYLSMAGAGLTVSGALLIALSASPIWLGWLVGAAGLATLYWARP